MDFKEAYCLNLSEKLNDLFYNSTNFKKIDIKIISGMAKGADTLAIRYADEHKLTKIFISCQLEIISTCSWFLRNEDMLSIATHLIAFWDGKSSGTKHMIDIAQDSLFVKWESQSVSYPYCLNFSFHWLPILVAYSSAASIDIRQRQ